MSTNSFGTAGSVECGQVNPLVNIGAHFTKNVLGEIHHHQRGAGSTIPNVKPAAQVDSLPPPTTFKMESLLRELRPQNEQEISSFPPVGSTSKIWTKEFVDNQHKVQAVGDNWANEYFPNHTNPILQRPLNQAMFHPHVIPNHAVPIYQTYGSINSTMASAKELLDDSKWVPEYDTQVTQDLSGNELQETAKDLLHSISDPNIKATEFMSYVEKLAAIDQSKTQGRDDSEEWATEYSGIFNENPQQSSQETEIKKEEFWENMQKEWLRLAAEEANSHPFLSAVPETEQKYKFNEWNPFEDIVDPLSEGKRRLAEGDIPSAALAFEAAVNKLKANTEAWFLLGTTQAQNEQDPLAIIALKKCVELDPSNLTALMTLAASLTNESLQLQAANTLKKWLKANPKYSKLLSPDEPDEVSSMPYVSSILPRKDLERVQRLFMEAARMNPRNEIDPEVQSGLGILFNLSNDYAKATDCFQAALSVQPNNSLLWNRLGATQANGGNSAEAISSYRRALEISPGFIRTRYNLGISCVNLSAYREAAEHFLSALNQQSAGKRIEGSSTNLMSDSIWSSMRMVLHLIDRSDLSSAVDSRDLAGLNKEFNIS